LEKENTVKNITVEICCGSAADVYEAARAGADRVELNCALFLGGLTPSIGQMTAARDAKIEIFTMIRPREGGFCYSETEIATMIHDVRSLLGAGADGVVFGVLNADGTVDEEYCARLMEAAAGAPAVFHRAFDVTPDWRQALDTLCSLGFVRVLTSGQAPSADIGAARIREMVEYAKGRIEILPGAGIREYNAVDILSWTNCNQIHVSLRAVQSDLSCAAHPEIHFGGALYQDELSYGVTNGNSVKSFINTLNKTGGVL